MYNDKIILIIIYKFRIFVGNTYIVLAILRTIGVIFNVARY